MGYSLTIGELVAEINYEGLESSISLDAKDETREDAPAFGEPTDKMNSRWPSYSSWSDAMEFLGLYSFMFDDDTGLIREHPGAVPIVKEHKEILDAAYEAFYKKYPKAVAGFSPSESEDWPKENNYAVRLEWLKYWVDWSLINCKRPVFHNS